MSFHPKCLALAAALLSAASAADVSATVCRGLLSSYAIESGAVIYRADIRETRKRVVVDADPGSFRRLDEGPCSAGYARDRNAVYYEGVKVPGADPKSFEPVEDGYAKDAAWWYGAGMPLASRRGGDLKILSSGYAIHPEGAFHGARRLEADGFELLGYAGYARTRNRVYFKGEEIAGIDAASFKVFPDVHSMARDKHRIVMNGRVEDRFDAASFQVLFGTFVKDRNHVYFEATPVEGADAASAAWIGQGYWRDARSVSFSRKAIVGADPNTFRLADHIGDHAVDRHRVYRHGEPLAGVDAASFQVIWFGYAKDRNGVYHYGRPLPGADPESFSVRRDGRGRDKSYGFQYHRRVCAWTKEAAAALPMCDPVQY